MPFLSRQSNNRLIYMRLSFSLFRFLRKPKGLVGSRAVVAVEERLAVAHTLHAGPVRRACRRVTSLYTHAQNSPSSSKYPNAGTDLFARSFGFYRRIHQTGFSLRALRSLPHVRRAHIDRLPTPGSDFVRESTEFPQYFSFRAAT